MREKNIPSLSPNLGYLNWIHPILTHAYIFNISHSWKHRWSTDKHFYHKCNLVQHIPQQLHFVSLTQGRLVAWRSLIEGPSNLVNLKLYIPEILPHLSEAIFWRSRFLDNAGQNVIAHFGIIDKALNNVDKAGVHRVYGYKGGTESADCLKIRRFINEVRFHLVILWSETWLYFSHTVEQMTYISANMMILLRCC